MVFTFSIQQLKIIYNLYSQCLTQTLSKTVFFLGMEGVLLLVPLQDSMRWERGRATAERRVLPSCRCFLDPCSSLELEALTLMLQMLGEPAGHVLSSFLRGLHGERVTGVVSAGETMGNSRENLHHVVDLQPQNERISHASGIGHH